MKKAIPLKPFWYSDVLVFSKMVTIMKISQAAFFVLLSATSLLLCIAVDAQAESFPPLPEALEDDDNATVLTEQLPFAFDTSPDPQQPNDPKFGSYFWNLKLIQNVVLKNKAPSWWAPQLHRSWRSLFFAFEIAHF